MRVERLFSSQGLRPAHGVYDRGGADATAGALSALRTTQAAHSRAAARVEAAQASRTGALVRSGAAQKQFAASAAGLGETLAKAAALVHQQPQAVARRTEIENGLLAFEQRAPARRDKALQAGGPYPDMVMDIHRQSMTGDIEWLSRSVSPEAYPETVARIHRSRPLEEAEVSASAFRQAIGVGRDQFNERRLVRLNAAMSSDDPRRQFLAMGKLTEDRQAMVELGVLGADEAARQAYVDRIAVWRRVSERWSRNDPSLAVALLERGAFDHLLPTDEDRAAARRDFEAARKRLGSPEVEKFQLDRRLELFRQSTIGGDGGDPALARDIARRGSAEQRRAFETTRKLAASEREIGERYRFQPFSAWNAVLSRAKASGGLRQAAALRAYNADLRDWHDDPALMAGRHPAAQSLSGLMAVQRSKGIPQPSCYTRAQAASVVAALREASPAQRREILDRQRRYLGQELNAALRDLGAAGLGAGDRLRLLLGDSPDAADLLGRIEAVENSDPADLRRALGRDALAAIDGALTPALAPYLDSMAPALEGGGLAAQRDDFVRLARTLAQTAAVTGQDPARAVAGAVVALFGARYRLADGLRIPRRYDGSAVLAHAERQRGQPLADFAADPETSGVDLPADVRIADWRADIAVRGRFATTPDDRGAVLLTPDGLPVRDASGRPFGFTFDAALPEDEDRDALLRRYRRSQQTGRATD